MKDYVFLLEPQYIFLAYSNIFLEYSNRGQKTPYGWECPRTNIFLEYPNMFLEYSKWGRSDDDHPKWARPPTKFTHPGTNKCVSRPSLQILINLRDVLYFNYLLIGIRSRKYFKWIPGFRRIQH